MIFSKAMRYFGIGSSPASLFRYLSALMVSGMIFMLNSFFAGFACLFVCLLFDRVASFLGTFRDNIYILFLFTINSAYKVYMALKFLLWHKFKQRKKIRPIPTVKIEFNQMLDSWFRPYTSESMKITKCHMNAGGNLRLLSNDVKIFKHNSLNSCYEKVKELQAVWMNRLPGPLWKIYTV